MHTALGSLADGERASEIVEALRYITFMAVPQNLQLSWHMQTQNITSLYSPPTPVSG